MYILVCNLAGSMKAPSAEGLSPSFYEGVVSEFSVDWGDVA